MDLRDKDFPGRQRAGSPEAKDPLKKLGVWYWESGFDRDPITELEWIRDQNFRAMYGAWDTLKNVDRLYPSEAYVSIRGQRRKAMADQLTTVSTTRLSRRVGPLGHADLEQVERSILVQLGLALSDGA